MTQIMNSQPPMACDLEAMNETQQRRHAQLGQAIEANLIKFDESPDGMLFRLQSDSETLLQVAEFITLERLCCPFLHFSLEVEANGGPLWLRLKGGVGDQSLSGLIATADVQ